MCELPDRHYSSNIVIVLGKRSALVRRGNNEKMTKGEDEA